MQEFMLYIRNTEDSKNGFSPELHKEFVTKCEVYIGKLQSQGKLISAQPMVREGKFISGADGAWNESPYNEGKDIIVGYYHIRANDMDDAIEIAKGNPEFVYTKTARIEVRPLKMKEAATGFVYPTKA
jgi:hypothetical protein